MSFCNECYFYIRLWFGKYNPYENGWINPENAREKYTKRTWQKCVLFSKLIISRVQHLWNDQNIIASMAPKLQVVYQFNVKNIKQKITDSTDNMKLKNLDDIKNIFGGWGQHHCQHWESTSCINILYIKKVII